MAKKKAGIMRDIKSKLMVAICMLLVSSIMMVSSTYAWFTLSTAPEVTGITTSVGANGNLEMALLPKNGQLTSITSNVGDSALGGNTVAANTTWGNLVDLSDSTTYGLNEITLYPSALNVATWKETGDTKLNPATLASALLQTPVYGSDGRVSELKANTTTGTYIISDQNFANDENSFGVRAVGTASGMTDRELAFRNALSAGNTAMTQAKNLASQSLNANGNALANIAIAHGVDSTAKHNQDDVTALLAIVNDLLGTEGEDGTIGVLEYIQNAYMQYILAYAASKAITDEGAAYKGVQALISAENASLQSVVEGLATYGISIADTDLNAPIDALIGEDGTIAKVTSARTDLLSLQSAGSNEIPWNSSTNPVVLGISAPLYKLANTNDMQINDIKASEIKENMSALVNGVASNGLTVTMASGGGVYADIADHCGDYTASITIKKVEYNGLTLNNMNARMATASNVQTAYLAKIFAAIKRLGAGGSQAETNALPISDMYGYIIDLAFRTNAAESNLLLSADAVDRIYAHNSNDETMGGGSTMTFKATTTDFSDAQVRSLMSAIRIVFFTPGNTVVATAKLDMTSAESNADGITAKMYLYTIKPGGTTTEYRVAGENETATHIADDSVAGGYRKATGEEVAVATHIAVTTTNAAGEVRSEDNAIMPLTQNVATQLSMLVYLDGSNISNADVAATGSTSMKGTMNLQFASSANLVPMEYAVLYTPDKKTPAETTTASSATETPVAP